MEEEQAWLVLARLKTENRVDLTAFGQLLTLSWSPNAGSFLPCRGSGGGEKAPVGLVLAGVCSEAHLGSSAVPHKPVMVGDPLIPQSLSPPSPPVVDPAWQGLGGRLAVQGKARQSWHGGELGSGGSTGVSFLFWVAWVLAPG